MAKLEISLFGQFKVLLNSAPVTAFESVKVRALLAYLSTEAERPQSREALAGLLWPDWPQQSAIRNLRNTLVHLRQNIGDRDAQPPFLLVSRESIQLNPEADAWVDVVEFETAISKQGTADRGQGAQVSDLQSKISNLKSTIDLYRGLFLDGFPTTDSAPFEELVLAKREYFSQLMLKALGRLAEWEIEQGEYEQAEGYARRQIELEPWREQAYQQLMRALSLKGQRVQALAQFESLKKTLQHELKVEPSEDTLALYQQIRDGELQRIRDKGTGVSPTPYPLPPLAIAFPSRPTNNLPIQLTSFIGREKEIDAVTHSLQANRLVTLTGPGGTGKTRLALQTAAGLVEQYADGVWLVELAPLSDPALVPTLTARALGLRELTGPQVMELLQDYLEPLHLLLILDNCEHVIEACARLADALLQACPKLSILISSREALGIPGEVPFRVPPLSLPEADQSLPIEALGQYEAIRLFVERATTISPGFTLTPANAPAILQICQRLDGIPLAIELAAARTRLLQVDEIALRLDDRFRLLTGGSRAALPRYQTLRASIDWSYELLSEQERALMQRLSVFTGGWVLEAAEAVGCGNGIQACDVLELLGMLVDKSLIQVSSEAAGLSRYRMLETIRQYAHEKLVEAGQAEAVRNRHLQYYLELAERVEGKIRSPDQATILERLEAELDNQRLALAFSLEGKGKPGWNPEPGLRLASALWQFWYCRGRQEEGIYWLGQLLDSEAQERGSKPFTNERIHCRARALFVASHIALKTHEYSIASKLSSESRQMYQSMGPEGRVGYAWACYAYCDPPYYDPSINPTEATRILDQALVILREAGDLFGVSEFLDKLADIALERNEYEKVKAYDDEILALRKKIGDLQGLGEAILGQGIFAQYMGDFKQARAYVEESMRILSAINSISKVGMGNLILSHYDRLYGNYEQSAIQAHEVLSIGRRQGDLTLTHFGLISLGRLALLQDKYAEASKWFEQDLAYFLKKDHKYYIQEALLMLGRLALASGNLDQAFRRFTDLITNFRDVYPSIKSGALTFLGKMSLFRGELPQALAYFQQLLAMPNSSFIPFMLEDIATLAVKVQNENADLTLSAAARIMGATEAWHQRFLFNRSPRERQEREDCITAMRSTMNEQTFAAAWKEGQAMTQEQAVEYAKGLLSPK